MRNAGAWHPRIGADVEDAAGIPEQLEVLLRSDRDSRAPIEVVQRRGGSRSVPHDYRVVHHAFMLPADADSSLRAAERVVLDRLVTLLWLSRFGLRSFRGQLCHLTYRARLGFGAS